MIVGNVVALCGGGRYIARQAIQGIKHHAADEQASDEPIAAAGGCEGEEAVKEGAGQEAAQRQEVSSSCHRDLSRHGVEVVTQIPSLGLAHCQVF